MKTVPPSNAPALIRALGADPVVVTIKGAVQPDNRYGTITLRRARGSRDPIGSPATCSLDIGVDAPPTWQKGDPISVKLSDAALAKLYPLDQDVRTNLMPNPSIEGNANLWAAANGSVAKTVTGTAPEGGSVLTYTATGNTGASTNQVFTTLLPVTAGVAYYGEIMVKAQTATPLRLIVNWYTAASAFISSTTLATTPGNASGSFFVPLMGHATAPANAAQCRMYVVATTALAAGPGFIVDACLFERYIPALHRDGVDERRAYFDGDINDDPVLTYAWTGTAHASTSTVTSAARSLARYRFQGRISDLTLTTTRGTARANIIATGFLAALGGIDVGDVPWPAESVRARVLRVLGAANAADAGISYQVPSTYDGPQVPAKDVDRQPAQQLLEALSETTAPKAGIWEKRDGTLYWSDGFSTGIFPQLDLDGTMVAQPLQHVQAPRINQVTVVPSGKPRVGQLLYINQCTNPSFEVNTTGWAGSNGTGVRDTVVFQAPGVASCKVTSSTALEFGLSYLVPNMYDGANLVVSAAFRRPTAGPVRILCQWMNAASTVLSTYTGPAVDVAANTWTRVMQEIPDAPAGTTQARVYLRRAGTVVVGDTINIDRVAIYEPYGGIAPKSLDYFDGASTSPTTYTYTWEGTAHASRSWASATADTPQPSYTYTDQASAALYGVRSETVNVLNDVGAAGFTWGNLITRAQDQLLAGGWAPPDMTVDVLALLDGRTGTFAQTAETPAQAAAAILLSELGSGRSYYPSGDEPAFIPDLSTFGIVTALNETISAHRWTIATSAERTY